VEHVVGQDQLARLDPGDVGQQPRQPAFADMERPGGNVDPGQPVLRFAGTLDPRQGCLGFSIVCDVSFTKRAALQPCQPP
jgi:hypothetical protein